MLLGIIHLRVKAVANSQYTYIIWHMLQENRQLIAIAKCFNYYVRVNDHHTGSLIILHTSGVSICYQSLTLIGLHWSPQPILLVTHALMVLIPEDMLVSVTEDAMHTVKCLGCLQIRVKK